MMSTKSLFHSFLLFLCPTSIGILSIVTGFVLLILASGFGFSRFDVVWPIILILGVFIFVMGAFMFYGSVCSGAQPPSNNNSNNSNNNVYSSNARIAVGQLACGLVLVPVRVLSFIPLFLRFFVYL